MKDRNGLLESLWRQSWGRRKYRPAVRRPIGALARGRRHGWPNTVLVAAAVLAVAVGCGRDDPGGAGGRDSQIDPAILRYGYGPLPDDSVTYQPGVVIVGGGPRAIRSVSSDGLVWTIDRSASGAATLQRGQIMFATSQAVGRVVRTEVSGGDLLVTLAPVELTDVVRDAHITLDQPIDLESASFQTVPDLLGADEQAGTLADAVRLATPEITLAAMPVTTANRPIATPTLAFAAPSGADVAPAADAPVAQLKATAGSWQLGASKSAQEIRLTADHNLSGGRGLKAGLEIRLGVQNLKIHADVPVVAGVVGPSSFRIDGIRSIGITLAAGASDGPSDNRKVRIELPIALSQPMIIGGFPVNLTQRFKLIVQTAFSAKNGNLSASGQWGLAGPLGFDGTTLTTPAFTVEKSILDSLSGISVGANGIVVATEFRFGLQIGLPVAGAGPYTGLVASVGLTNGSGLGLVKCQGATLLLSMRGGVGISLSSPLKKALDKVLGIKVPEERDVLKADIVNVSQTRPDVPLCRG